MTSELALALVFLVVVAFAWWLSWRLSNVTVTLSFASKTNEPEASKSIDFHEAEVDEAMQDYARKRFAEPQKTEAP